MFIFAALNVESNSNENKYCGCGEIGRHARLRI